MVGLSHTSKEGKKSDTEAGHVQHYPVNIHNIIMGCDTGIVHAQYTCISLHESTCT